MTYTTSGSCGWTTIGKPKSDGSPLAIERHELAVVVAAQHADVRPRPAGAGPLRPSAVVLHVEPAGRGVVPDDLVHALAELGIRIGREAGADALLDAVNVSPPSSLR